MNHTNRKEQASIKDKTLSLTKDKLTEYFILEIRKKMGTNEGRQITGIIVGCGNRGQNYAEYARYDPKHFRLIAIADPRTAVRQKLQKRHSIEDKYVYDDWRRLADSNTERLADCVLITLPDREHYQAVIQFAKKGYHILLEKPMATKLEHCKEIVQVCQDSHVLLAICHVLRYLPAVKKIKDLIENNVIGKLVSIQHIEPIGKNNKNYISMIQSSRFVFVFCLACVGFSHFAHSYVRGNWHNEDQSCFSLLAKCCHDLDLIQYWMQPRQCTNISSFGKLMHFISENKPKGAGDRCLTCSVESTCPYSAKKIYLEKPNRHWPVSVVVPDIEEHENWEQIKVKVKKALEDGPYGKCIYGDCKNDVVDQQVVIINFDDGKN